MKYVFQNISSISNVAKTYSMIFLVIISKIVFSYNANSEGNYSDKNNQGQKSNVNIPQLSVVLLDGTSSYRYLAKAKRTALNKLMKLPHGSKVYVRWVTNESYGDENSIVSFIIPQKPIKNKNPFANPKTKRNYKIKMAKYQLTWKRIAIQIQKAQSPNSNATDIMGALLAASKRFKNNSDYNPLLIMLTDLDGNVNHSYDNIDLKNTVVKILDYQVDSRQNKRQEFWVNKFKELGASDIKFVFIDDIID